MSLVFTGKRLMTNVTQSLSIYIFFIYKNVREQLTVMDEFLFLPITFFYLKNILQDVEAKV